MNAAEWALARPWLITEEGFGMVLSIAERRNESPEAVEARMGRPLDNAQSVTVRDGVAIVPVVGPIFRYADFFTQISGATSVETLAKDFNAALNDRSIRAIVLNVDSPGGTASGVSEFAAMVKAARGTKPICSYVGSQAASAGYWIASAADGVVADSTAILGSIGVVMGMPRKKATDPVEIVSSQSPRKRPDVETEAGRSQVQAMADDLADLFVSAVAENRGVSRETVLSDFGRGDQFVASKAMAAGMIDGIGSLESCIASLARGEMPCPPKPKPAPKRADNPPRRAAMSEPNAETISAAEAAELRKQLDALKARLTTLEADNAGLKASNKKLQEDGIRAAAGIFAENEIRAGRASVPEREGLAMAYVEAASDDAASPRQVSYSANGKVEQGSRVDALRAAHACRPPSNLGRSLTTNGRVGAPPTGGDVLHFSNASGDPDPKTPTPERQAELKRLAGLA